MPSDRTRETATTGRGATETGRGTTETGTARPARARTSTENPAQDEGDRGKTRRATARGTPTESRGMFR